MESFSHPWVSTLSPGWYALLVLASLAAGFVDSIAGGGGLITVPALLSAGLSPQAALGTNKLQASFGSGNATFHFAQARLLSWRDCRWAVVITFLASILGALAVQQMAPGLLRRLIPVLLIGIALYMLFQPAVGLRERPPRLTAGWFAALFGTAIGFYDGFFGPGTGSFWAVAAVALRGYSLTQATAFTKAVNFASNLGALAVFCATGQVHWTAGLLMGAGQWTGARLGSRLVIRKGARFIRPIFIAVVLAITVKLLVSP